MKLIIALLTIVTTPFLISQDFDPKPNIGWDSLHNLLTYPKMAQKINVDGVIDLTLQINWWGEVKDMSIKATDDIFLYDSTVVNTIKKTKWPVWRGKNGMANNYSVPIRIQFHLKGAKRKTLIIEGD